jgi:hypothetical protein
MRLKVFVTPGVEIEVDAVETDNPELAIHRITVGKTPKGTPAATVALAPRNDGAVPIGEVWAVTHIATGKVLLHGLLTPDLAQAAARMLSLSGNLAGAGRTPYFVDAFQAAASLMADCYFSVLCPESNQLRAASR